MSVVTQSDQSYLRSPLDYLRGGPAPRFGSTTTESAGRFTYL